MPFTFNAHSFMYFNFSSLYEAIACVRIHKLIKIFDRFKLIKCKLNTDSKSWPNKPGLQKRIHVFNEIFLLLVKNCRQYNKISNRFFPEMTSTCYCLFLKTVDSENHRVTMSINYRSSILLL